MPDPVEPTPPAPPPIPGPEAPGKSSSTGLPSNVAAALACFPLIGGIIFYIIEKTDRFVRFYAMQSIIFGGAWFVFGFIWRLLYGILAHIPALGWVFAFVLWAMYAVVHIGAIAIWIITMIKAFSGVRWDIPYIGPIARKQVDDATT